jgi:hypothetical protein
MDRRLTERALALVQAHQLPRHRGTKHWAAVGDNRRTCTLCGRQIRPGHLELELAWSEANGPRTAVLHLACHRVWREAVRAPAGRSRSWAETPSGTA